MFQAAFKSIGISKDTGLYVYDFKIGIDLINHLVQL